MEDDDARIHLRTAHQARPDRTCSEIRRRARWEGPAGRVRPAEPDCHDPAAPHRRAARSAVRACDSHPHLRGHEQAWPDVHQRGIRRMVDGLPAGRPWTGRSHESDIPQPEDGLRLCPPTGVRRSPRRPRGSPRCRSRCRAWRTAATTGPAPGRSRCRTRRRPRGWAAPGCGARWTAAGTGRPASRCRRTATRAATRTAGSTTRAARPAAGGPTASPTAWAARGIRRLIHPPMRPIGASRRSARICCPPAAGHLGATTWIPRFPVRQECEADRRDERQAGPAVRAVALRPERPSRTTTPGHPRPTRLTDVRRRPRRPGPFAIPGGAGRRSRPGRLAPPNRR